MKKIIVVSGINIRNAGTLTIFHNFLDEIISAGFYEKYEYIIMVSKRALFEKYSDYVTIIDFPKEESSRLRRFYYEYIWMRRFSKRNNVYCWISLNDKTPKVKAEHQFVYCHNPSIFYKCTKKDFQFSKLLFLYTLFYGKLYRHNIERNDAVIVQQHWIAEEFIKRFPIDTVYVMRPTFNLMPIEECKEKKEAGDYIFIYPTAPRTFKNCEVLLEAAADLNKRGVTGFKVYLTIKGTENSYANYLYERYGSVPNVVFCGFLTREELEQLYANVDCLVFPSKLETWGLPMTEFSRYGKNIIAADLPYAHETLAEHKKAIFFNPGDCLQLSSLMEEAIRGMEFMNNGTIGDNEKGERLESWTALLERF